MGHCKLGRQLCIPIKSVPRPSSKIVPLDHHIGATRTALPPWFVQCQFTMDSEEPQKPLKVHFVSAADSPEFIHLTRALARSSVIGLDAEWKPGQPSQQSTFPTVSLLQLACCVRRGLDDSAEPDDSPVFLLDLSSVPLPSIWEILKEVFASPDILKLGFRFKQDLKYLSSTFQAQGCGSGFDRVSNSTVSKLRFVWCCVFQAEFCSYVIITVNLFIVLAVLLPVLPPFALVEKC